MATITIASSAQDATCEGNNECTQPSETTYSGMYFGRDPAFTPSDMDMAFIFRATGIPQGATLLTCALAIRTNTGGFAASPDGLWHCYDVDSPADFNNAHTHRLRDHHALTSASVAHLVTEASDPLVTPSLIVPAQVVVNRASFSGDLGFVWVNVSTVDSQYLQWLDYAEDTSYGAVLTVTWEEGIDPGVAPDIRPTVHTNMAWRN